MDSRVAKEATDCSGDVSLYAVDWYYYRIATMGKFLIISGEELIDV